MYFSTTYVNSISYKVARKLNIVSFPFPSQPPWRCNVVCISEMYDDVAEILLGLFSYGGTDFIFFFYSFFWRTHSYVSSWVVGIF